MVAAMHHLHKDIRASQPCTLPVVQINTLHPRQHLQYIECLTRRVLPPTRAMIRNFAVQIAQTELGEHWVDRFVQRYPNELFSK
jgi:hypothetical protein